MSSKLILLACLIGAASSLGLDKITSLSKSIKLSDGDLTNVPVIGDATDSDDSYKWWEASDNEGFVKKIDYLSKLVNSMAEKTEDLRIGADAKKWSAAYNKAVEAVVKLIVVIGNQIDYVFPGLGTKYNDMCIAHFRSYVCMFQTKKLLDWHGGQSQPDLCTKSDYGSEWGVHSYDGDYSSAADVIKGHGVANVVEDLQNLLNKYGGKNGKGFDVNIRAIVESLKSLATIVEKLASYKKADMKFCADAIYNFLVITGCIAENVKSGLGAKVTEDFGKFYEYSFLGAGYPDLSSVADKVKSHISACGPYDWGRKRSVESYENKTIKTKQSSYDSDSCDSDSWESE